MEDINLKKEHILETLSFLGKPKNEYRFPQLQFNCPVCSTNNNDKVDNKYNLEINVKIKRFNCWKCDFDENMHGKISNLFFRFGKIREYNEFKLYNPDEVDLNDVRPTILEIPHILPISESPVKCKQYLLSRSLDNNHIIKYNIGYVKDGKYANRLIIPSYNSDGIIDYFVTRRYDNGKDPYLNPVVDKTSIIFNDKLIDWSSTIFIVEGVFDHFVIPNSIPLLGKVLHENLYKKIYSCSMSNVVILLDNDAYRNAVYIFKKLNSGRLYGKVSIINPPGKDPSKIFENEGKVGILNILRKQHKPSDIYL